MIFASEAWRWARRPASDYSPPPPWQKPSDAFELQLGQIRGQVPHGWTSKQTDVLPPGFERLGSNTRYSAYVAVHAWFAIERLVLGNCIPRDDAAVDYASGLLQCCRRCSTRAKWIARAKGCRRPAHTDEASKRVVRIGLPFVF